MGTISPKVADALEAGRQRFNARVSTARKAGAVVDTDAFLEHLRERVAPLVELAAEVMPERIHRVLEALFNVSLELFAAGQLGSGVKSEAVCDVWTRLLPAVPRLLVQDPSGLAAAVSNAVVNLSSTHGARPGEWVSILVQSADHCTAVAELLAAGKVAAWRAGMPQYRSGALKTLKALEPSLALAVLGLDVPPKVEEVSVLADRMLSDPWLSPKAATSQGPRSLRLVRRAGTFRGFGGDFLRPPIVWSSEGCLFVSDGDGTWRLIADVFGSVFVRQADAPPGATRVEVSVSPVGEVNWEGERARIPEIVGTSCSAACGGTLAFTLANSHHVFLVARASPERYGGSDER